MDIRDRRVDCLILKARPYREQDRLLYLTSCQGPERAIARGAQKPGGKLTAVSQPFCRVELVLSPAKDGLSFVREGLPQESFVSLKDSNLSRFAYASYLSELALTLWPEGKAAPELFGLLLAAFSLLKLDPDHARTARFTELRLLSLLGWLPELNHCAVCGREITLRSFCLSPSRGALLCEACAGADPAPRISAGAVMTMRRLLDLPLPRIPQLRIPAVIQAELEAASTAFLDYHLDYTSRVKKILAELL